MKRIITTYLLMILFIVGTIYCGINEIIPDFALILMISLGAVSFILAYIIARTAKFLTYLFIPFAAFGAAIISFVLFGAFQILLIGIGFVAALIGFVISKIMHQ